MEDRDPELPRRRKLSVRVTWRDKVPRLLVKLFFLIAGFGLCVGTVGVLIWFMPYREYIHNAYPYGPLAVLAIVAFLLAWLIGAGVLSSAVAVASSYPAATLIRIVMDCAAQPTRHNLWPFEIAMSAALGIVAALPAAAIGRALRLLTHGRKPPPPP